MGKEKPSYRLAVVVAIASVLVLFASPLREAVGWNGDWYQTCLQ